MEAEGGRNMFFYMTKSHLRQICAGVQGAGGCPGWFIFLAEGGRECEVVGPRSNSGAAAEGKPESVNLYFGILDEPKFDVRDP